MKKISYSLFAIGILTGMVACHSGDVKPAAPKAKTQADSLIDEIEDAHGATMGKLPKLGNAKAAVQRLLDSLAKLPAKAQQEAAPYQAKLSNLLSRLQYDGNAMDKWMEEINLDSFQSDVQKHIEYLTGENSKVATLKSSLEADLRHADSVVKRYINQ